MGKQKSLGNIWSLKKQKSHRKSQLAYFITISLEKIGTTIILGKQPSKSVAFHFLRMPEYVYCSLMTKLKWQSTLQKMARWCSFLFQDDVRAKTVCLRNIWGKNWSFGISRTFSLITPALRISIWIHIFFPIFAAL